ncbi:hypothetical protein EJ110_NYTH02333 [Nymphaea thermarum]|nr:hypothetical protein EJ110_NYTH02333 [Nymphaea thermarum]
MSYFLFAGSCVPIQTKLMHDEELHGLEDGVQNVYVLEHLLVLQHLISSPFTVKRISDTGLWLVELFCSFWAYVWLYNFEIIAAARM